MTYPPQQPGQFGQSSYQGLGSYSGGGPGAPGGPGGRNTGKIVAIVVIAVLVLGGGGVATYFLTKGDDRSTNDASPEQSNRNESKDTRSDDTPSDDASPDRDQDQDDSGASNTPDDVREDYMAAYENKDFADVVDNACRAYKTKFGTDTSALETKLAGYDISASPDGDAEIDDQHPETATAKIDLKLVGNDETQEPKILIKIVQERGEWRFCGEGAA